MKKSVEDEAVAAEEALRKRTGKPNLTDAQREDVREHARREALEARLHSAKAAAEAGNAKPAKRKGKGKGHEASDDSSKE